MPNESAVKIVVPDDFPPALTGSVAEAPLKKMGQVRVFTDNGVLRAVENIQLFLEDHPRDLVVPPPGR